MTNQERGIKELQTHLRLLSRQATRLDEVTIDNRPAPPTGFWWFPKDFDLFHLARHLCNGVEAVVFNSQGGYPGVWNLTEYLIGCDAKRWSLVFHDNDWREMGKFYFSVGNQMRFRAEMVGVATVSGVTECIHRVGKRYSGLLEGLPQLHPYPVETIRLGSRSRQD